MLPMSYGRRGTFGVVLLLWLLSTPGHAQTLTTLQEKNHQLEAELQRLKTEYSPVLSLTGAAKQEILAMAAVLAAKPAAAIDFSHHSGEMCFVSGQGNMIHYAVDPSKTSEDVIYMLPAEPFIASGLQVSTLPTMPLDTGKMTPFQWYYYDGTAVEPHHGRALKVPYLMMSVDVK
jgi:hypothetical protein